MNGWTCRWSLALNSERARCRLHAHHCQRNFFFFHFPRHRFLYWFRLAGPELGLQWTSGIDGRYVHVGITRKVGYTEETRAALTLSRVHCIGAEREREREDVTSRPFVPADPSPDGRTVSPRPLDRLLHAGGQFLHVDRQPASGPKTALELETHHRFPAFLCQLPDATPSRPDSFPLRALLAVARERLWPGIPSQTEKPSMHASETREINCVWLLLRTRVLHGTD
jgi:hypothetical protein